MENKLRREARRFLEKAILKYDGGRTGAITRKQMAAIIKLLLKEDPHLYNEDELTNVIDKYSKDSSFIVFGGKTRAYEFVVDHEEDRLDFLAVQDITIHFMKKQEKQNNDAFLSKHLIRLHDFPSPWRKRMIERRTKERKKIQFFYTLQISPNTPACIINQHSIYLKEKDEDENQEWKGM